MVAEALPAEQMPNTRGPELAGSGRKLCEVSLDRVLVPFEADPRDIGYVQEPVLDLIRSLENGIGPSPANPANEPSP